LGLLVVVASYGIGFFAQQKILTRLAALAVILISLEALPKTLVLPENPYRVAPRDWPQAGSSFNRSVQSADEELVARLKPLSNRSKIISDDASLPRIFARIDTVVIPLWSPEVDWLFDRHLKSEEIARRWRKSGIHYLVLAKSGPAADFVRTHAQWRAPYFTVRPVAETEDRQILEATVDVVPPR
jgi:hypothetical protein